MNQNDFILTDILLAEKSLYHYTKQAFKIIEPKTEFVDNWHIELLCDYLQCVSQNKQIDISILKHFAGLTEDGRINNLLLCFPPRTLKSILVSIMLPSWHWIYNPHEKFLCGASSYRLSTHDSVKCRDIIKSDWYQDRWGDKYQLMDDQNTKQIYKNTEQGERMSVSVDSMVTGSGGDLLLADDLNDMGNIESQTNRENVLHFFNNVFSTRENNIKTSRRITMQQRGHASDVAGDMIAKEDKIPLTKLIIKAIATEDEIWVSPLTGKIIKKRKAGELLSPNRMPKEFLDSMKIKLGSRGFEAQFQQSPKLEQGNIIKVNNFKYLKEDPKPIQIIQSIDTAFKTGEENDYSVVQTWFRFMLEGQQKYYLKSVLKGRFEFPELQAKVVELAKRFKPDKILIEDKASGQSLIQVLRQDKYLHHLILPIQVDKDKVTRAYAVTPIIERGDIYLPEASFWVEDFKAELSIFPYGEHDDQLDSMTQALNYLDDQKAGPRIRVI